MAILTFDCLRHFQLFVCNRWRPNKTYLDWKWVLNALCQVFLFSGPSKNQVCRPGFLLAETISISPLKPPYRIWRNLTRKQVLNSSTCSGSIETEDRRVFGVDLPSNITSLTFYCLRHFLLNFCNRRTEFDETKWESRIQRPLLSQALRPIQKQRWLSRPLIGWYISDFPSATAEQNFTKLFRSY